MRIVHYLNQFFGGIGGEEQAGSALRETESAVGPGRLLEQTLADGATVVKTLICGDNYAVEHQEELTGRGPGTRPERPCGPVRGRPVL